MTNGWDGTDPSLVDDGGPATYELATRFTATEDISITGMRVWSGNTTPVSGRNGRLWSTGGSELQVLDISDSLSLGWNTFTFDTPQLVLDGASIDVSYSATQYYSAITGDYPNPSSDGAVNAIQGRFATAHGTFPSTTSTAFYGVDIIYSLAGDNFAPEITGITFQKADLAVIANVTLTDEVPEDVTLTWNWGDGVTTSTGAGVTTNSHTYSANGLYALLVTATDQGGLTDTFAAAVSVSTAGAATGNEEWFDDIFDAVVSDAQRSAYFDKVNKHEPKHAPRTGLTAAIWLEAIDPIGLISGLASTSARLVFKLRVYQSMLMEPQDMIDPRMAKAVANLMRRYHDDFDFEGAIRNIDLLGAYGVSLSAITGYLDIDGKMFRIADLTIPCLVNDVWPQVK